MSWSPWTQLINLLYWKQCCLFVFLFCFLTHLIDGTGEWLWCINSLNDRICAPWLFNAEQRMWQWCTLDTELSLGWKLGQNGSNSQQSHHDSLTSALTKDTRTLVVLASTCFPSNMWLARLWNRAGKLRCCSVPSPSCPVGWWVSFTRSLLLRVWVLQTTGTADNTDMKNPRYVLGRMGLRTLQRLQWCE